MVCEYIVYWPVPSSGYLPWSFSPLLPCSLHSSLNPSSARFLPPAVHASSRPFLARSLHQPSLPQPSLAPLALSACLASSLPLSPSPCSLPPSLPPSLHPLVLSIPHHSRAPSLLPLSALPPPSLHPSFCSPSFPHPPLLPPSHPLSFLAPDCYIPPFNSMYTVTVCLTRCTVLYSSVVIHDTETMPYSKHQLTLFERGAEATAGGFVSAGRCYLQWTPPRISFWRIVKKSEIDTCVTPQDVIYWRNM